MSAPGQASAGQADEVPELFTRWYCSGWPVTDRVTADAWQYALPAEQQFWRSLDAEHAALAAREPDAADGDVELLKRAVLALTEFAKIAITVKPHLDKPYPGDPRWSPWTRWVERPAGEAHDLAMVIRKRIKDAPQPQPAPRLAGVHDGCESVIAGLETDRDNARAERDQLRDQLRARFDGAEQLAKVREQLDATKTVLQETSRESSQRGAELGQFRQRLTLLAAEWDAGARADEVRARPTQLSETRARVRRDLAGCLRKALEVS